MDRIGNEIERELSRSGSRDAVPLAAVTTAWPAAVGDAVARHAWPLRISRDGTLHVAVESATWAQELVAPRGRRPRGAATAARRGGAGEAAVRGRADPRATGCPRAGENALGEPPEVPPEIESEASSAAAAIDDPELRELVARAARTSLLKARSGR